MQFSFLSFSHTFIENQARTLQILFQNIIAVQNNLQLIAQVNHVK